ncbi:hypothetical protein RSSM_01295 [Rhodopirellula sallentina SM41]|uniref:Uncharacterized protein n=1 Tax=Rhodopirellula sallentina SM41 TaxID=1263870 RepID=M5U7M4_9BACT|nr:hypothetical protein RSSM_01295 [Rhodopirellula sallentina SM41]
MGNQQLVASSNTVHVPGEATPVVLPYARPKANRLTHLWREEVAENQQPHPMRLKGLKVNTLPLRQL